MRKIFKGVLILLGITILLSLMPSLPAMAADTETFVYKSPYFSLTVPKWRKTSSRNPNSVLRKALEKSEETSFDVAVSDLSEGKTYKDLAKDICDRLEDEYGAYNCRTLYERDIKLKDGTPAYELEVKWMLNLPRLTAQLYCYELAVFVDKKIITITVASPSPITDKLKEIPLSLTLK